MTSAAATTGYSRQLAHHVNMKATSAKLDFVLGRLHEHGRNRYHIEYRGFFSNHVTHGIIALYRLGASESRIDQFISDYRKEHKTDKFPARKNDAESVQSADELKNKLRGKRENYLGTVDFLENEKKRLGSLDSLLQTYLPQFIFGAHGAALHPLIHTGFAIDIGCEEMAVDGLAYMNYAYVSMAHPVERVLEKAEEYFKQNGGEKQENSQNKREQTEGGQPGLATGFTGPQSIFLTKQPAMFQFATGQSVPSDELFQSAAQAARHIKSSGAFDGLIDKYLKEKPEYEALDIGSFQRAVTILSDEEEAQALVTDITARLVAGLASRLQTKVSTPQAGASNSSSSLAETVSQLDKNLIADTILEECIEVYALADVDDFFLLHGVTAAWALKHLMQYFNQDLLLTVVAQYFRVLLVVYVVQGMPTIRQELDVEMSSDPVPTPEELCAKLLSSDETEEHVFKLVYACLAVNDEIRQKRADAGSPENLGSAENSHAGNSSSSLPLLTAAKKLGVRKW